MSKPRPITAVVTGASSGIGFAVARALLSRGATLVGSGRSADRLARAAAALAARSRFLPAAAHTPAVARQTHWFERNKRVREDALKTTYQDRWPDLELSTFQPLKTQSKILEYNSRANEPQTLVEFG